jgi:hypothetical protein
LLMFSSGGFFTFKLIDQGILETFGPFGFYYQFRKKTDYVLGLHSGNIFHYILLSSMCIIGFLLSFFELMNWEIIVFLSLILFSLKN